MGVHQEMKQRSKEKGFNYYRLDVKDYLSTVRLGEWKPLNNGKITLTAIEAATADYLRQPDVRG